MWQLLVVVYGVVDEVEEGFHHLEDVERLLEPVGLAQEVVGDGRANGVIFRTDVLREGEFARESFGHGLDAVHAKGGEEAAKLGRLHDAAKFFYLVHNALTHSA